MCFPDFCFSNRKACDLCSPENLSGDYREHRGKCENRGFSPALQMDQSSLKISPKTKKPTRGPVGGESRKWSTILKLLRNLLSTSKRRIFQIPSDGVLQQSRKILHEITRTRTASKLSVLAYNLLQLYPYKRTTVKRTRQSTD